MVGEPRNYWILRGARGTFQSRCRDWVVGEQWPDPPQTENRSGFSLVAEIGWLASLTDDASNPSATVFQSRCRDWVVGE